MAKSSATQLALRIETPPQGDLRGIEMGLLPDGRAFLSQRGVAELCGVAPSVITEFFAGYPATITPRVTKLLEILGHMHWAEDQFYSRVRHEGRDINAYPDTVVAAFVQYYAIHQRKPKAIAALGLLATKSLRELVYSALGLDTKRLDRSWESFHERLLLNPIPAGWFSVFAESASMVVQAIRGGLEVGPHTVPDGSIGAAWGKWWTEKNLDRQFGSRRKHPHRYPDDHPQAAANDFIEANIYPIAALGEFRRWMEDHYLPTGFPRYIERKVASKAIDGKAAVALIQATTPRRLPK